MELHSLTSLFLHATKYRALVKLTLAYVARVMAYSLVLLSLVYFFFVSFSLLPFSCLFSPLPPLLVCVCVYICTFSACLSVCLFFLLHLCVCVYLRATVHGKNAKHVDLPRTPSPRETQGNEGLKATRQAQREARRGRASCDEEGGRAKEGGGEEALDLTQQYFRGGRPHVEQVVVAPRQAKYKGRGIGQGQRTYWCRCRPTRGATGDVHVGRRWRWCWSGGEMVMTRCASSRNGAKLVYRWWYWGRRCGQVGTVRLNR